MKTEDFKLIAEKYPAFRTLMEVAEETAISICETTENDFEDIPYSQMRLKAYRIAFRQFLLVPKTERQKLIRHKSAEIFWGEPFSKKVRKKKSSSL